MGGIYGDRSFFIFYFSLGPPFVILDLLPAKYSQELYFMALTKKDLVQINDLIASQLSSQLSVHLAAQDARFALAFEQHAQDIKRDIRDEMDVRFRKTDARIDALDKKFTGEIQSLVHVILSFFPERFESLEGDVARLKRHVGIA